LLVSLAAISGCGQTVYQPLGAADSKIPQLDRRVSYRLDSAYLHRAPECAAIRVTNATADPKIVAAIEGAVERHLAMRIPRVIGAAATRRTAVGLGIGLKETADWRQFSRQTGCNALMSVRLRTVTDSFWGVWANREIGLELTLTGIGAGQRELWAARHTAGRSDGGVPLSLLGLPFSVGRAAVLTRDEEAFQSIADDAVRRMMVTLPDIRGAFPATVARSVRRTPKP